MGLSYVIMRAMSSKQEPVLSEAEYTRLRHELSTQLRREVRRSGRQHMFAIGMQAALLVFFAVMLFLAARRYHDLMLWVVGFCLLIFACTHLLELDFLFSGHSWMDVFQRDKSSLKTSKSRTSKSHSASSSAQDS